MRSIDPDVYAALQQRRLVYRDFVWLTVKERETLDPVTDGYWSGTGTVQAYVIDATTGVPVQRTFYSAGGLVNVSDVSLVSTIQVHNVTITLSQLAERVNELVRQYDCKQGQVQIYRGLYSPETRVMVAPAEPRFVGTIDSIAIKTPAEGGEGVVEVTCTSHTQELTRSNPDTRSDASQRVRNPIDAFYQDTTTVGTWTIFWGKGPASAGSAVPGMAIGDLARAVRTGLKI